MSITRLLQLFFLIVATQGREVFLEPRNPLFHPPNGQGLVPRRFGQENKNVLSQLGQLQGCPPCGNLGGPGINTVLAAAPECAQQDHADKIIDAAKDQSNGIKDEKTRKKMIDFAVQFRQAEKNTPPDFSVQPPINRNSVFCQKAPKNPELNGLVQAQDPANDPNIFFDPAKGKSVRKGEQPNTAPFKGNSNDVTGGGGGGGDPNGGGGGDNLDDGSGNPKGSGDDGGGGQKGQGQNPKCKAKQSRRRRAVPDPDRDL